MSFLIDYLRKEITAAMEDPQERDRRWEERLKAAHSASLSA